MTEFNAVSGTPSNVSKKVENQVNNIKKMEGNSKKIDTQVEYDALQNLINSGEVTGKDNLDYVKGFMIEFENNKAEVARQELEDSVSRDFKKKIDKIIKNGVDDIAADKLLSLLKNTKGDLSNEELNYIRQTLLANGYPVPTENKTDDPVNVPQQPIDGDKKVGEDTGTNVNVGSNDLPNKNEIKEPDKKPDTDLKPDEPSVAPETKLAPVKPKKPAKPAQPTEPTKPETPEEKPKNVIYRQTENGRLKGQGLADGVCNELEKKGSKRNEYEIRQRFKDVDKGSAFAFVGHMKSASNDRKVFMGSREYIDAACIKNVISALMKQAEAIGLGNTKEYKNLEAMIIKVDADETARRNVGGKENKNPSISVTRDADNAVIAMYNLMSKTWGKPMPKQS